MFKMIGGDGVEYGPVSAEQLWEWIAECRANGQTLVQPEGGTEWVPLAKFTEFADALAAASGAAGAEVAGREIGVLAATRLELDAEQDAGQDTLRISDCLGRAWALLGRRLGLAVGGAALVWLMLTAAAMGGCVGGLISLVLSGPLYGGLTLLYLNLIRERPASLANLFSGFGPAFVPLMLVWLVSTVLSELGMALCVLPGLFLKVIWVFGLALVADKGMAFWPALELSRQTVTRRFFRVAGLMLLAYLPLVVFQAYSSYRTAHFLLDHFGPPTAWQFTDFQGKVEEFVKFAAEMGLQQQLVLLINLPFACAAVLYAYEHFFGKRKTESSG